MYAEKQADDDINEADEVMQLMEYVTNFNGSSNGNLIFFSDSENPELSRKERTPEYDILSSVRLAAAREKAARERGLLSSLLRVCTHRTN